MGSNLRLKIAEAQQILETVDPVERLDTGRRLLNKELEVSTVQAKIQSDAKEEMSRSQREYFLREQMQALKTRTRRRGCLFRRRLRSLQKKPEKEKNAQIRKKGGKKAAQTT